MPNVKVQAVHPAAALLASSLLAVGAPSSTNTLSSDGPLGFVQIGVTGAEMLRDRLGPATVVLEENRTAAWSTPALLARGFGAGLTRYPGAADGDRVASNAVLLVRFCHCSKREVLAWEFARLAPGETPFRLAAGWQPAWLSGRRRPQPRALVSRDATNSAQLVFLFPSNMDVALGRLVAELVLDDAWIGDVPIRRKRSFSIPSGQHCLQVTEILSRHGLGNARPVEVSFQAAPGTTTFVHYSPPHGWDLGGGRLPILKRPEMGPLPVPANWNLGSIRDRSLKTKLVVLPERAGKRLAARLKADSGDQPKESK